MALKIEIRNTVASLPLSPTLEANQRTAEIRQRGGTVFHMGFGQSPFPVHPILADALGQAAGLNHYESVAGRAELRERALEYLARKMEIDAAAYDVVVAPGSKLLLYALQMAIAGDIVIPVPSWVSYAPQAVMLGDRVVHVDTELSDAGYRIDPANLRTAVHRARRKGLAPTKIILSSPNNPTGLMIPQEDFAPLANVCREEGLCVLSDEIYGQVAFDGLVPSFATAYPAGTTITTGLSKNLSLGGWRLGFALIPKATQGLFEAVAAIASETWSSVTAPVQSAALVALSGDPVIEDYIALCTRIHRAVARYVAQRIASKDLSCARPQGAFYLWPDFDPIRQTLASEGISSSTELARHLLQEAGVLALPGESFEAPRESLTLRLSTCDYDGAEAIDAFRQSASAAPAIIDFAPNVAKGADAIVDYVKQFSSSALA